MSRFPTLLLSLFVVAGAAGAQTRDMSSTGIALDRVIAIVNEGIVLQSQLDAQTAMIEERLRGQGSQLPPADVIRQQVLERLILQEIQVQRAGRLGVQVPDEMLNEALRDVASRNNIPFEQMPAALETQGVDYAMYREEMRREIMLSMLRQRDVFAHRHLFGPALRVEHILASCAVPSIFPAVQIGADAYWDGLFSDNPPVEELMRPRSVGAENLPDEIWLIKINPTARARVPVKSGEIIDRRNQLEGNISLFQQLGHIELINDLILAGAFRPERLARFDIASPVRIPKSFASDPDKPYHIPCIEMPVELQDLLDYEGKIDRGSHNIGRLIAEGEKSAAAFLRARAAAVAASPMRDRTTQGESQS